MRKPTIKELNNTICAIREVYPFSDNAEIILFDLPSMSQSELLTLHETDDTGADVMISKKILFEVKDDERGYSDLSHER